jgi:hypothetical protein
MQRAPAAPNSFVRGKTGQVPFWPGGLDESLGLDEDAADRQGPHGLQTIPPGFTRGLRLPGEVDESDLPDALEHEPSPDAPLVRDLNSQNTISDGFSLTLSIYPPHNRWVDHLKSTICYQSRSVNLAHSGIISHRHSEDADYAGHLFKTLSQGCSTKT